MKHPLIIVGAGKIAEAVSYYFNRDSNYEIVAYTVDDAFAVSDNFLGKPLIKISEIEKKYPKDKCKVFVAMGYQGINSLRSSKYLHFNELGYEFASYVSPFVKGDFTLGENTIVMDNAIMQPRVTLGNDVFVWGGAMIGHHAIIEDHCWLTGGALIGGIATLGESTFVGLGASVGNEIKIGKKCMIGAQTLVTKSLDDKSVVIKEPTKPHRLNSDQFTRMSACFRVNL